MMNVDNAAPWNLHPSMLGTDIVVRLNFAGADGRGSLSFPQIKGRILEDLGGSILLQKTPEPGKPNVVEQIPKVFVFSVLRDSAIVAAGPGLVLPGGR